jgi:hypothetical protein
MSIRKSWGILQSCKVCRWTSWSVASSKLGLWTTTANRPTFGDRTVLAVFDHYQPPGRVERTGGLRDAF